MSHSCTDHRCTFKTDDPDVLALHLTQTSPDGDFWTCAAENCNEIFCAMPAMEGPDGHLHKCPKFIILNRKMKYGKKMNLKMDMLCRRTKLQMEGVGEFKHQAHYSRTSEKGASKKKKACKSAAKKSTRKLALKKSEEKTEEEEKEEEEEDGVEPEQSATLPRKSDTPPKRRLTRERKTLDEGEKEDEAEDEDAREFESEKRNVQSRKRKAPAQLQAASRRHKSKQEVEASEDEYNDAKSKKATTLRTPPASTKRKFMRNEEEEEDEDDGTNDSDEYLEPQRGITKPQSRSATIKPSASNKRQKTLPATTLKTKAKPLSKAKNAAKAKRPSRDVDRSTTKRGNDAKEDAKAEPERAIDEQDVPVRRRYDDDTSGQFVKDTLLLIAMLMGKEKVKRSFHSETTLAQASTAPQSYSCTHCSITHPTLKAAEDHAKQSNEDMRRWECPGCGVALCHSELHRLTSHFKVCPPLKRYMMVNNIPWTCHEDEDFVKLADQTHKRMSWAIRNDAKMLNKHHPMSKEPIAATTSMSRLARATAKKASVTLPKTVQAKAGADTPGAFWYKNGWHEMEGGSSDQDSGNPAQHSYRHLGVLYRPGTLIPIPGTTPLPTFGNISEDDADDEMMMMFDAGTKDVWAEAAHALADDDI